MSKDEIKEKIKAYYIGNDIDKVLDYITNLQQENKQLKELKYKFFDDSGDEESFTLEDYLEIGNKLYDYEQENKQLKERIDKAIEFLHNENVIVWHVSKKDLPDEWEHIEPLELLEILDRNNNE